MEIPREVLNIGTVVLSGVLSLAVARYTVNQRVDKERERNLEEWYVEAGVQAELAENDWANQILSEASGSTDSEHVLRERPSKLEEHAAQGNVLDAEEKVVSALQQIAANYRYAALILERGGNPNGPSLKDLEDEMWTLVDQVRDNVPNQIEYS